MMYLLALILAYGFSFVVEVPFLVGLSILIIIPFMTQLVCYYNQINDIEKITECKANIVIYKEQSKEVLTEIKLHLIDKYPEHELKVFEMLTSNTTADVLAVKYPELKTDTVFKKYIDSLIKYKNSIYNEKKKINKLNKDLKIKQRTIALSVFPISPKEKDIS